MKRWSVLLFLVLTLVLPVASGENNSAGNGARLLDYHGETIWFLKGDQGWMTGWSNSPGVTPSLAVLAAGILLYLLPWAVASKRRVHADGGIVALNLFFGWSVVGWFGALMWAMSAKTERQFQLRQAAISARTDMADFYLRIPKTGFAVEDAVPLPSVQLFGPVAMMASVSSRRISSESAGLNGANCLVPGEAAHR